MKDNSNLASFDSLGANTVDHYKELRELREIADRWRSAFVTLLFLVVLVVLSQYMHPHGEPDAIPSQAWAFGEPGQ